MNNQLEVFKNSEFGEVRTMIIDNEPYFVGKDVAKALGYIDESKAVKMHVDEEDKLTRQFVVSGQNRNMYVVNESGLYSLILSSKLPSAKKFKRWVTSEVLPSIRKHGMYMTDNLYNAVMDNPEILADVFKKIGDEKQATEKEIAGLCEQLQSAVPKAIYFDHFVDSKYAQCFRDVAKQLEIPQKCFINLLLEHKFIYRNKNNELRPYSKPLEMGLFILRDFTNPNNGHKGQYTLVTNKGKKFIYEYLVKKELIQTND